MSPVHVRIGRLVVDAPLRGEAAHWGDAIVRALRAQLTHGPATEAHVPEAIARHVADRVSDAAPATNASGGRRAGV
jgi:hypothetical protein